MKPVTFPGCDPVLFPGARVSKPPSGNHLTKCVVETVHCGGEPERSELGVLSDEAAQPATRLLLLAELSVVQGPRTVRS